MEPEDRFDRNMEFLARQMANLFAQSQTHQQEIEKHSELIESNSRLIESNSRLIESNSRQIGELTGHLSMLGRIVERVIAAQEELARRQAQTDERLNILIGVVERYFPDGRSPA